MTDPPGSAASPAGPIFSAGWWGRASLLAGAALAFTCFFTPEINPDLFWHLSAGRWIVEHGAVPRADFLSHTLAGRPWCDFEWLSQLLYYGAYSAGHYTGFILLRMVLLTVLLAASLRLLRLFEIPAVLQGPAVLFIILGQNISLRPDLFSLILFCAVFWALESFRLGRLEPRGRHLAFIGLGFCLWANLHLGFAFGLLLIGFYAAGEAIEAGLPWVYGRPGGEAAGGAARRLRLFLSGLAAASAGSLLNPYGWKVYEVLWEHSRLLPALQDLIIEWQPPSITDLGSWPYWLLAAGSLVLALLHFLRTRRTPYAHLLALAYLAVVSSTHVRHRTFFFLLAVPLSLAWVRELRPGRGWARALGAFAALVGALMALEVVKWYWPIIPAFSGLKWCSEPAWEMTRFLAREPHLKGRRLMNVWHHGGYLGFRLHPDYQVFFDGRYIFHDLLLETSAAGRQAQTWVRLLDKHGVELACLQRTHGFFRLETYKGSNGRKFVGGQPYYFSYMPKAVWALVYWDQENMVFARRSSVDAAWLEKAEYRLLLPDVEYVKTEKSSLPRLRRELAWHLRQTEGRGSENLMLQRWAGEVFARGAAERR